MVNQPLNNRGDESAHKALVSAHKALVRRLLETDENINITCIWVAVESIINYPNIQSFCINNTRIQYKIIKPFGIWKASVVYVRLLHLYMKRAAKSLLGESGINTIKSILKK